MSGVQIRRSLLRQMNTAEGPVSYTKMVAAPRGPHFAEVTEDSIADQDWIPQPSPGTVNPPLPQATSPASTESLLERLNSALPSTPMTDPHTGLLLAVSEAHEAAPVPTDLPPVKALIKNLIPEIAEHCLELDRAHMALQPPHLDGLPRDVIVKPHFYAVKEEVMRKSRYSDNLTLNGHKIQIFADFLPYTVQKRRSLKPLQQLLIDRDINYRWSFPLRLNFYYKNKSHSFSSFAEGEHLLSPLGLVLQEPPSMQANRGTPSSTKRPPPDSPLQPSWMKQNTKRSKENLPP